MNTSKGPKIDAKHFHYYNDGTGRDQYVRINNGGLLSQKMLISLELSPKGTETNFRFPKTVNSRSRQLLPPAHQKIQHYFGDGKGRDNFVILNDGGQVQLQSWKDHPDVQFPTSLRNYQKPYSSPNVEAYLMPNNQKLQSITFNKLTRQTLSSRSLARPKPQIEPERQLFMPNQEGNMYKTYQQLKYQSKAQH